MAGVGPGHPCLLQQLQGIGRLRDVDPAWPLSHLDAELVAQQSEVGHLEQAPHLQLELIDVAGVGAGDHQVVDVDPDDEPCRRRASRVHAVLRLALREAELEEACVELGVPGPWCLLEAVERLYETEHQMLLPGCSEAGWQLHIYLFLQLAVEEG